MSDVLVFSFSYNIKQIIHSAFDLPFSLHVFPAKPDAHLQLNPTVHFPPLLQGLLEHLSEIETLEQRMAFLHKVLHITR